ncbi:oxygen-independent coproporphyrinogen III oxidase HemN [Basidiobolus meristosporus CBS 931.73]|uniref:coproporphyrinogen dehydrogenase n=1 Tax=Basidiobolus meristosporus CBS 931.73 TaxID=1314790 RepID=A0A1Y1WA46_9FUNG|nr:oxygen-independent coproporphyrinogen III oxidase HemN [Basidiobolus meristosporus CBS 931.73]ORX85038.1 oxygen-independent coproporphyrinogen III oxidase HemN [Basidiobolus meristosporus CBS 931.73]|eukprot:ORX70417.1 oxygen-independent coproporphyrinogen III oxidase HemN [Basidiobolus meristosporus CBS 931.73]
MDETVGRTSTFTISFYILLGTVVLSYLIPRLFTAKEKDSTQCPKSVSTQFPEVKDNADAKTSEQTTEGSKIKKHKPARSLEAERKLKKSVLDSLADIEDLVCKYDVPAPRYTSYPPVPFWNKTETAPTQDDWLKVVKKCFDETNDDIGMAIYVHLPYCEQLCHYCACTKVITKYHDKVEDPYIDTVLKEWAIYRDYLISTSGKPNICEIYLGGGTPTFFSPSNLQRLINGLLEGCSLHPSHEFSFEAHPNSTSEEHLQILYDLGFRKLSLGIQDFDPDVQQIINRVQTYETVDNVMNMARRIGYTSICFDLIYGLPNQTMETTQQTITMVGSLQPDRIAYYSYAHVPWVNPRQRNFTEHHLPSKTDKRALYELGKKLFADMGYRDVGMDHFALPTDQLFIGKQNGTLHRNFMGYVAKKTQLLVGLGMSAISDAKYGYAQNEKNVKDYTKRVENGELPLIKGHEMTREDLIIKKAILDVACQGKVVITKELAQLLPDEFYVELKEMKEEGIVEFSGSPVTRDDKVLLEGELVVLSDYLGTIFLRNVCKLFDPTLRKVKYGGFSQAI